MLDRKVRRDNAKKEWKIFKKSNKGISFVQFWKGYNK